MRSAAVRFRVACVLRPLIGVIVAYAVATQSLLLAIGGFALPAQANDGAPAVELCLHDTQLDTNDAGQLPAGNADHAPCTHCMFCFAGSHQAVIGWSEAIVHRVDVEIVIASVVADKAAPPRAPPHSIASPRGPPFNA
jgi:hypothetical protein